MARTPTRADRWWLWLEQHPTGKVIGFIALLLLIVVLFALGDYLVNLGLLNRVSNGGH